MFIPTIYIITNKNNTTLYIGVTSNLPKRIWQHKRGLVDGFSKKYNLSKLVWYQTTDSMYSAITKEKQLKEWKRNWKDNLINQMNPDWKDLYFEII